MPYSCHSLTRCFKGLRVCQDVLCLCHTFLTCRMKPAVVGLAKVPELGPKLLRSSSNEVAGFILTVLHSLTYLPLVLLPIMQDAHLKLVVVLNTTLCLCLMAGNVLFHFLGIVKVRWCRFTMSAVTVPPGNVSNSGTSQTVEGKTKLSRSYVC